MHTLGLEAGAVQEDIRTAFRRLAKELHPDVTGQKSDFRFKQITGAYNLLKALSNEELNGLSVSGSQLMQKETSSKIDAVLDKYTRELKGCYAGHKAGSLDMQAAIIRLKSHKAGALRAVLKHSVHLVNRTEFRKALSELLNRPDIDEGCARIIAGLPFDAMTRKLLALDCCGNARNMPVELLLSLMGNEPEVMEGFLPQVRAEDFAAVLRRWPSGRVMSVTVVRKILENTEESVLVPMMALMAGSFPQNATFCRKRLSELEGHPTAAVRAWAKKLV